MHHALRRLAPPNRRHGRQRLKRRREFIVIALGVSRDREIAGVQFCGRSHRQFGILIPNAIEAQFRWRARSQPVGKIQPHRNFRGLRRIGMHAQQNIKRLVLAVQHFDGLRRLDRQCVRRHDAQRYPCHRRRRSERVENICGHQDFMLRVDLLLDGNKNDRTSLRAQLPPHRRRLRDRVQRYLKLHALRRVACARLELLARRHHQRSEKRERHAGPAMVAHRQRHRLPDHDFTAICFRLKKEAGRQPKRARHALHLQGN